MQTRTCALSPTFSHTHTRASVTVRGRVRERETEKVRDDTFRDRREWSRRTVTAEDEKVEELEKREEEKRGSRRGRRGGGHRAVYTVLSVMAHVRLGAPPLSACATFAHVFPTFFVALTPIGDEVYQKRGEQPVGTRGLCLYLF